MTTTEHLEQPEWHDEITLNRPRSPFSVYVSGPMTGRPRFNFDAFHAASAAARAKGWTAISPAEHDLDIYPGMEQWPGFDAGDVTRCPSFDFHKAMVWDLQEVAKADGIILLPGWEKSTGAGHELDVALACGKRIFVYYPYQNDAIIDVSPQWIDERLAETREIADEKRVVDPTTGGAKGQKIQRFDLVPAVPLSQLAEHFGRGAEKYEDRNWERGYAWSLSFGALMRHAWAFWAGEDLDPELGSPHLSAVAFHAFALLEFMRTHTELDDRP